jgi:hypothetical protein
MTSILFYCFFLICFIVVSFSSFGIINWIIDPRQGYQFHRTGYGVFYAFSYLFLSTSCVLFTLYAKRISSVYIASIVFFGSAYLLGSKGYILAIFVYFLILLGIRRRSHLYKFSVVGVIIVIPMLLINFGSADLSDIASYFDFYPNSAMYYREYFANKIDLFYGEIWVSDFYSWLPRSVFPDKPYVYGFLHVNEYFFPGAAEATNVAGFAGPVAAFADFGVLGVIFFGFMNVQVFFNFFLFQALFRDYDENNIRDKSDKLYVFIYLFAPLYLAFFNFLLGLIVYMIVISSISFLNRLRLV